MKKQWPIVIAGVLAFCVPGDWATAQPRDPEPGGPPMMRPPMGMWRGMARGRVEDLTDTQREAIFQFVKSHSPRRWEAFERLPDNDMKRYVERSILSRNRIVLATRDRGDSALYELLVKRVEAEDEAWSLSRDVRDNPALPETAPERVRLKEIAGVLVDLELRERELRLEHLRQAVAREEAELLEDRANIETAINDRMQEILHGERRRRGGGGPGGGPPGFDRMRPPGGPGGPPPEFQEDWDEEEDIPPSPPTAPSDSQEEPAPATQPAE